MRINQGRALVTDFFILILNLSIYTTVLPSVIFGNFDSYVHQIFILIINFLYLLSYGKVYINIKLTKKNFFAFSIIVVLALMFLLEIPRYIVGAFEGVHLFRTLLSGISILSFAFVINNIYTKIAFIHGRINSLTYILKIYIYYCLIIVSISNFILLLWFLGFIDIFSNPIPVGFSTFIDNNIENSSASYFSPLNITIVTNEARFGGLATFSGFSYEPHIATHFITPAMFIMNGLEDISRRKKIFYTFLFLLFLVSASSATNMIILFVICALWIFIGFAVSVKRAIFSLIGVIILIAIFYFLFDVLNSTFLFYKITSATDSSEYSRNFLEYVISPVTFWGDGVFNVPYPYASVDNIGLIFSILIVYFYAMGFFVALSSIGNFYKNKLIRSVGFGALYFFLHSLKIVQLIFIFPYTIFIVFVLFAVRSLQDDKVRILGK